MFGPVLVTMLPWLLTILPFSTSTPTSLTPRACEQPYYQYDNNVQDIYLVNFTDGYTLDKHFETIGEKFAILELETGYGATLDADLLAKVLSDCGVQFIEDDTSGSRSTSHADRSARTRNLLVSRGTQDDAPWPLYQLSAAEKDPSDKTHYYLDDAGQGVDVYVLDSGINHPQDEFNDDSGNDRVRDLVNFSTDPDFSDTAPDPGHGTLVASVLAGNKYGVAKSATILNCKYERNGAPDNVNFVQAMQAITRRHNSRKRQAGFKGSILNMSFQLDKTRMTNQVLNRTSDAGISMVSGAGNDGYDDNPDIYPARHPRVVSVASSREDYTPDPDSNYGEDIITLWAPGKDLPVIDKNGEDITASGTSLAAGYVSGVLAIFYGVEGMALDPDEASYRLITQTDEWVDLPDDGTDWHNSPRHLANTGNRKGAAQDPPLPYLGGPEDAVEASATTSSAVSSATPTPSIVPTEGCQSPDHDAPLTPFKLDQGDRALTVFISECQGVRMAPEGPIACTLYYNPCSEDYGAKAVDVTMTVWQSVWAEGKIETWPDVQEMSDAVRAVMNNCDTGTTTEKWGGYKSVSVDAGMRMYNISASQNGEYPEPPGFETVLVTTSETGTEDCAFWNSA